MSSFSSPHACISGIVTVLMLCDTWLMYWWILTLWCKTNYDRIIFILLTFSVIHNGVLHALIRMDSFSVLSNLDALIHNDDPLWIFDVLSQHIIFRLQSIMICYGSCSVRKQILIMKKCFLTSSAWIQSFDSVAEGPRSTVISKVENGITEAVLN